MNLSNKFLLSEAFAMVGVLELTRDTFGESVLYEEVEIVDSFGEEAVAEAFRDADAWQETHCVLSALLRV